MALPYPQSSTREINLPYWLISLAVTIYPLQLSKPNNKEKFQTNCPVEQDSSSYHQLACQANWHKVIERTNAEIPEEDITDSADDNSGSSGTTPPSVDLEG